jgi:hypothetical protein
LFFLSTVAGPDAQLMRYGRPAPDQVRLAKEVQS